MTIKHIAPAEAFAMLSRGATLVDIRETDEWRREHVPLASHHPLSSIERNPPRVAGAVIFHCRSGNRTAVNAQRLAAAVPGAKVYVLEGGIEAWRDAGFPSSRMRASRSRSCARSRSLQVLWAQSAPPSAFSCIRGFWPSPVLWGWASPSPV